MVDNRSRYSHCYPVDNYNPEILLTRQNPQKPAETPLNSATL